MAKNSVVIGGASGFWGETSLSTGQLLTVKDLDYLVYDYLAEVTMSIMARARQKDAEKGYAVDFVTDAMTRNIKAIAKRGIKVLSNAGGVNPAACGKALEAVIAKAGLDLKVAVVEGDDLVTRAADFTDKQEMFSDEAFPDAAKLASVNAYLGARPVVAALDAGADIVITGRCADSALALAACMHEFGWSATDYDLLSAGSLVGHLLECGPQATGGNFTDWRDSGNIAMIGYPVATVTPDGAAIISKPDNTSGIVSTASVGEQMLYEIGDPRAYILPDVICDFSDVTLEQTGDNQVCIANAKGRAPSGSYKVSATFMDGFRAGTTFFMNGVDARDKAKAFVESGLERARMIMNFMGMPDYDDVCIEYFGGRPGDGPEEEITVKSAVRHNDPRAVGLFLKEQIGGALATPPGLHGFTGGGRPKPSPVVRLFSFLLPAADVPLTVRIGDKDIGFDMDSLPLSNAVDSIEQPEPATVSADGADMITCRLEDLAWGRSGDKGNAANVGIIARKADYLPWIWQALTPDTIGKVFTNYVEGDIERHYLPGSHSLNILMHQALGGGGVASLRNDSQGKGFAQILLSTPVTLPKNLVEGA